MCLSKLLGIFKKSKPLVIPHPEEPENPSATLQTVSISATLQVWFERWEVPLSYHDYWRTEGAVITVKDDIPYPAQSYDGANGERHLDVRPQWLNPGVIAHEQAHQSYALLSPELKASFRTRYYEVLSDKGERLLQLLYSQNQYMKTSAIEAHAEIYRFLGTQMPEVLKRYYPKLL